MTNPEGPEVQAVVDAVVKRLRRALDRDVPMQVPGGEADPEPTQLPWDPIDEGPAPSLSRRTLRIAGMELTQSIQHHGAAGESFGPDNSVPLVALKTLIARVYPLVRPGLARPDTLTGQRVTGELVLSVGHHVVYRTGPTRGGGVRIGPISELSRTLWDQEWIGVPLGVGGAMVDASWVNCSLNFRVPAHHCRRGRMHVAVRIWRVGAGAVPSARDSADIRQYVQFLEVPAPRITLVRVNWDDGSGTVTSPSDAQMLRTLRLAERMLPFPYFETTIHGSPLPTSASFFRWVPGGACNQAWKDLNAHLRRRQLWSRLVQNGGGSDIFFGMVPTAAIPGWRAREAMSGTSDINSGCGDAAGVGGGFIDDAMTFAHELGHIYDCDHVGVRGDDAGNDPDYPNYGGSKTSIGEVGIDTGTAPPSVYDPLTTADIMSYEASQWISPYTYRKILDARHMHRSAPADPRRVRPVLLAELRLRRTERGLTGVEVKQAFRIEAAGFIPIAAGRATSPLSIDLLDADRRIVTTHHCFYAQPQPSRGCGCGRQNVVPLEREPYIDLFEVIEWPGDHVTALAFHRGEAPFATVTVGEPPSVEIDGPERRQDTLVVRTRAMHPRETPAVALLFSGDDGLTWQPVGFDAPGGEFSVDPARLPGGPRCRFRAIAGAELRSAVADTEPFELVPSTRRLHLVTPSDECGILPGPVALSALIDTCGRGAVVPHEIRWTSSLQGEIGTGYDVIAELVEGEHVLTVTIPDGIGGLLTERAIIIVGGRPAHGPR